MSRKKLLHAMAAMTAVVWLFIELCPPGPGQATGQGMGGQGFF